MEVAMGIALSEALSFVKMDGEEQGLDITRQTFRSSS